jgi:hypothetical protein
LRIGADRPGARAAGRARRAPARSLSSSTRRCRRSNTRRSRCGSSCRRR